MIQMFSSLPNPQANADTASAMDEGVEVFWSGDSNGEGFIIPPDSASKEGIVLAGDDLANLYTVIRASVINLYF